MASSSRARPTWSSPTRRRPPTTSAPRSKTNYRAAMFEEGHATQVEVAGIVASSKQPELARKFLAFLLTPEAQAAPAGDELDVSGQDAGGRPARRASRRSTVPAKALTSDPGVARRQPPGLDRRVARRDGEVGRSERGRAMIPGLSILAVLAALVALRSGGLVLLAPRAGAAGLDLALSRLDRRLHAAAGGPLGADLAGARRPAGARLGAAAVSRSAHPPVPSRRRDGAAGHRRGLRPHGDLRPRRARQPGPDRAWACRASRSTGWPGSSSPMCSSTRPTRPGSISPRSRRCRASIGASPPRSACRPPRCSGSSTGRSSGARRSALGVPDLHRLRDELRHPLALGGGPGAATFEVAIYEALRFDVDFARAAHLAILQIGAMAVLVTIAAPFLARPPEAAGSGLAVAAAGPREPAAPHPRRRGPRRRACLLVLPPLAAVAWSGRSIPTIFDARHGESARDERRRRAAGGRPGALSSPSP